MGAAYDSPAGDFSTLIKLGDGRFQRTHIDQTVELFSSTNKLATITDRNGNVTQFQYNGNDNHRVHHRSGRIDHNLPLQRRSCHPNRGSSRTAVTTLTYQNGNLVSIQDPDTTARGFSYDSLNRLTAEVDKLGQTEVAPIRFLWVVSNPSRGKTVRRSVIHRSKPRGSVRPDQTNHLGITGRRRSIFGSQASGRDALMPTAM